MSEYEIKGFVQQNTIRSFGDGSNAPLKLNRRGELCVVDFYTQMALEKRGFEIRGGYDAAEETGDDAVATTAAEACVDAVAGITMIPCFFAGTFTAGTGTVHEVHLNAVGTNSTAGTAVAPLPLWKGSSIASVCVGQLDDEGGVTVPAGPVTTTNNLFSWGGEIALGAYNMTWEWSPLQPAMCAGAACVYVQVGSTAGGGAAPEYCFTLHFLEMPTAAIA